MNVSSEFNQTNYIATLIDPANYSQPVDLEFKRITQLILNQKLPTSPEQKFYTNMTYLLARQVNLNEGILTPEKLDEVVLPIAQNLDGAEALKYSPPESVPPVGELGAGNSLKNHPHLLETIQNQFLQQRKERTLRGQIELKEQEVIDYLKSKNISYEPTPNLRSDESSFLSKYLLITEITSFLSQIKCDRDRLYQSAVRIVQNNATSRLMLDEKAINNMLLEYPIFSEKIETLKLLLKELEHDKLTIDKQLSIKEKLSTLKNTASHNEPTNIGASVRKEEATPLPPSLGAASHDKLTNIGALSKKEGTTQLPTSLEAASHDKLTNIGALSKKEETTQLPPSLEAASHHETTDTLLKKEATSLPPSLEAASHHETTDTLLREEEATQLPPSLEAASHHEATDTLLREEEATQLLPSLEAASHHEATDTLLKEEATQLPPSLEAASHHEATDTLLREEEATQLLPSLEAASHHEATDTLLKEEATPLPTPQKRLDRASSCSATTKAVAVLAFAVFLGTLSLLRQQQ